MNSIQIYRILGGVFFVIGFISLMNTVTGFAIHGELLWRSALCTVMDFAVAWGFFGRHRWLMLLLLVNALGQLFLVYTRYSVNPDAPLYLPLFGAALALFLACFTFYTRRLLRWGPNAYVAGAAFLLSWGAIFSYTVVTWLA